VLNQLVSKGLLESSRGAQGGFKLPPASLDLAALQVIEAIDGPFKEQGCMLGTRICEKHACLFDDLYTEMRQRLIERFQEVKLSDFQLNSASE
jgi:Rrf2 family protein